MSMKPMSQESVQSEIQQFGFWTIILMFAWPAVWFTFLIYVIGRLFIPEGGTTPTWFLMTVIVLGTGAELVAGLVLLRREGYKLAISFAARSYSLAMAKGLESLGIGRDRIHSGYESQYGNGASKSRSGIGARVCPARMVASSKQSHNPG